MNCDQVHDDVHTSMNQKNVPRPTKKQPKIQKHP